MKIRLGRTPASQVFENVVAYHFCNDTAKIRIVAMHGALRAAKDLAVLDDLLPEMDLITIDLPGHGSAPHSTKGYTPEILASEVLNALAHYTDGRPVILLGESFSGLTAISIARQSAGVAHVILIDTPLDTQRMLSSQRVLIKTYLNRPEIAPMVAGLSRDFFGLDVDKRQVTPRTYFHYLQECLVPVTMVTGAIKTDSSVGAGAFFNRTDIEQLKTMRALTVVEVAAAGHSVLRTQPNAVAAVLRRAAQSLAENV